MPRAACFINRKPLLVASTRESVGLQLCPGLAAVGRPVHVLTKRFKKTEVEEGARLIGIRYWIAAKHIILQYAGKGPVNATVRSIAIAALPKVGYTLLNWLQPIAIPLRFVGLKG